MGLPLHRGAQPAGPSSPPASGHSAPATTTTTTTTPRLAQVQARMEHAMQRFEGLQVDIGRATSGLGDLVAAQKDLAGRAQARNRLARELLSELCELHAAAAPAGADDNAAEVQRRARALDAQIRGLSAETGRLLDEAASYAAEIAGRRAELSAVEVEMGWCRGELLECALELELDVSVEEAETLEPWEQEG